MSGFVRFTYLDEESEEVVTLGDTAHMPSAELEAYIEALPPANDPDSNFVADLWPQGEDYGHTETRAVSAEAIERELGRPLDALLAAGRAENDRVRAIIRRRLARP